ncbi:uncharacterized protein LOC110935185 [Helianthus annuus]|uniref:uncharacterized protein LOC110935185 n=1 Tax=Helianthus annuus TaxID=4232 RepID=UPI000B902114|nr:uncharacterized protein LOC110935185 [Helianthus annuus]
MDSPDSNPPFHFQPASSSPRNNNNQLPPRKRYKDDNDDDITPPPKRQQFAVPKDVVEGSASRTITTWRKLHEINLLKGILEYYKQNGTYPFDDMTHMQRFYKDWIENREYVDEDVFTSKMVELPERFFKDQDKTLVLGKNVKAWMPRVDVRIYELSHMIWGGEDDDGGDGDDGGVCVDPKVDDQKLKEGGS